MSSPDHPTANLEDAFSSNFPNYVPHKLSMFVKDVAAWLDLLVLWARRVYGLILDQIIFDVDGDVEPVGPYATDILTQCLHHVPMLCWDRTNHLFQHIYMDVSYDVGYYQSVRNGFKEAFQDVLCGFCRESLGSIIRKLAVKDIWKMLMK
ncbi:hypothetical protein Tco_0421684 [Tanacetum coccineum]